MYWSAMPFGKYKGKTLPKIILIDLDWFYWALPNLYGKIAEEAQDLARKARAIRIPSPNQKKLEVEYRYDLPLNIHPVRIRASAVDTPFGAV
jgi:hypothetical protein